MDFIALLYKHFNCFEAYALRASGHKNFFDFHFFLLIKRDQLSNRAGFIFKILVFFVFHYVDYALYHIIYVFV